MFEDQRKRRKNVSPRGFEPRTYGLEGRRHIQTRPRAQQKESKRTRTHLKRFVLSTLGQKNYSNISVIAKPILNISSRYSWKLSFIEEID